MKVGYTGSIFGGMSDCYDAENKLALGLAKTHGIERVRGGKLSGHPDKAPDSWNQLVEASEPITIDIFSSWDEEQLSKFVT